MSTFKRAIASNLMKLLKPVPPKSGDASQLERKLTGIIKTKKASLKSGTCQFQVSLPQLQSLLEDYSISAPPEHLLQQMDQELVKDVVTSKNMIQLQVNKKTFCKHVLESIYEQGHKYGYNPDDVWCEEETQPPKETVVVEFSSPNIAKPFHAGHLRSTIIGNFVANINEALGHKVHRLNYLGDWGTQFGLLLLGFERYGSEDSLQRDALQHLLQVYVSINQDVEREKAEDGVPSTYSKALELFRQLEAGNPHLLSLWEKFQKLSWEEYERVYQRLGVHFSDIHRESMFQEESKTVVELLRQMGLLQSEESGVCYVDVQDGGQVVKAKVLKSDGSTLYLSRDIAAALHRRKLFGFDRMHYVVETGQQQHFHNLSKVLERMGEDWIHKCLQAGFHIEFGRVRGMSTRRGEVVLLQDILDEARSRVLERMLQTDTTRVPLEEREVVADQVGVAAVIIQDLKEHRRRDYTFSWDRALNLSADSGLFLQYCHARLCSVYENSGLGNLEDFDPECLQEDIAVSLSLHLCRYPEVVRESFLSLEAYHVVHYLFQLGHLTNSAYRQLTIKGQSRDVARARLRLLESARITLANGLSLLGTRPLHRL